MTTQEAIQDLKLARCCDLRYTQERMAQELGCSLRTYSRWEKNGPPRPVQKLVRLMITQPAKDSAPAPSLAPAQR